MRPQKLFSPLLLAIGLAAICSSTALAQEYHNTTEQINGNWASGQPTVTFGPNADITINGDWYLTANTVTINQAAKIGGTGTLHIMTPATYGRPATATTLTAGGSMGSGTGIGCKVSLENGSSIIVDGNGSDLTISNNVAFARTGAHVVIGNRNMLFRNDAVPTTTTPASVGFQNQPANASSDFRNAYIVTNGIGVVGKEGLDNGESFTYPIGTTAAVGAASDYTPATVTNVAPISNRNLYARVTNYASSASVEGNVTKGIDRTWGISSQLAGNATISLTHNANTEGSNFNRNAAFVTQSGANGFSVGTPAAATTPNYTHTGTFNVTASGVQGFYSKSNDSVNSLTPFIAVSPKVFLRGAYNGTLMTNLLRTANLVPASHPYNSSPFNYAGTETALNLPANTTDWVLVELRAAAAPATVVATRAGLVMNDGSITDVDGVTPVSFRNTAPGNYFVAIRHRNHLGIRSSSAQTFVQGATTSYDFTTSQSQAYQNPAITSNTAQTAVAGGKFAMWAGNTNANSNVRVNGTPAVNDYLYIIGNTLGNDPTAVVTPIYSQSDVNMNGNVRVNGTPAVNDYLFILSNSLSNDPTSAITQHN